MKRSRILSGSYYIIILLIIYILLGIAVVMSCRFYLFSNQEKILFNQAKHIEEIMNNDYTENIGFDFNKLKNDSSNIKKYTGYNYIITGPNLKIYASSIEINSDKRFLTVPNIENITEDKITVTESTLGLYESERFVVIYPVTKEDLFFYIITTTDLLELQVDVFAVSCLILMGLFIAIIIAYYFILLTAERSRKPIIELNEIAKALAKGDFSKRIEIHGSADVAQLCENFNIMAESLSKQDEFKNEYISNISHDIRSPLTTIKGFVEAIMDGTIPANKVNHYLEIVYNEADRLSVLGQSLLELSKIDLGDKNLKLQKFDIIDFLRDCLESMEDKCSQKEITMELRFDREPVYVYADIAKMQRICYNLTDNAIKYTNYNGHIVLGVETFNRNKAYIYIKDNGIGISEENQKHIFERLFKVDKSRGKDKNSVGLGLAIVKEMIEAHGEKINVESELGKGTKFYFELPFYDEENESRAD